MKISIGRYWPEASPLHALDPRLKLAGLLVAIIANLSIASVPQALLALAFTAVLVALTKVPLSMVWQNIKPIFWVLVIVACFNVLYIGKGAVLVQLGIFHITDYGLIQAGLYFTRFISIILLGSVLLLTTTPQDLTFGFQTLLKPLEKLGAPIQEISLVLILALRFIPILGDEASQIADAQKARGAQLDSGGPIKRLKAAVANIVPMFTGAINHAEGLSRALSARGYLSGAKPTRWKRPTIHRADWIFLIACLAYVAGLYLVAIL